MTRSTLGRHAAPRRAGRTFVLVATIAGAVILPSGIAQAYWRSAGSGTGSAGTGTVSSLTGLTGSAASTGLLAPGGTGSLVVSVSNPNPTPITVTAISTGSVSVSVSGAAGTCTPTDPAISLATPSAGLPFTVPANGTATATLTDALAMGVTAASGCQSATFSVPVTLTGRTN
jgi:hypothetical protein